jgi:hypothetical protein
MLSGLLYTTPKDRNVPQSVFSVFATAPVSQGVQELAPSVLNVFLSQDKQNSLSLGRYVPAGQRSELNVFHEKFLHRFY